MPNSYFDIAHHITVTLWLKLICPTEYALFFHEQSKLWNIRSYSFFFFDFWSFCQNNMSFYSNEMHYLFVVYMQFKWCFVISNFI